MSNPHLHVNNYSAIQNEAELLANYGDEAEAELEAEKRLAAMEVQNEMNGWRSNEGE